MKNKNPFKMWGSWIGVLIGVFIFVQYELSCIDIGGSGCIMNPDIWLVFTTIKNIGVLGLILLTTLGFLLGWGITALWRKYK